ncbi:MAG: hypothetical protein GWO20_16550 [Candidatus Korarchaeota archaeon]|nr:hypothetical protein [Candidatus Korarchaeota archaeon]
MIQLLDETTQETMRIVPMISIVVSLVVLFFLGIALFIGGMLGALQKEEGINVWLVAVGISLALTVIMVMLLLILLLI